MNDLPADDSAAMTTKNKRCTSQLRESLDTREICIIETASSGQNLRIPSAVAGGRFDRSLNRPTDPSQASKAKSRDGLGSHQSPTTAHHPDSNVDILEMLVASCELRAADGSLSGLTANPQDKAEYEISFFHLKIFKIIMINTKD